MVNENVCHPRMILSGIHGFKVWIPDYTLGNDILFVGLNSYKTVPPVLPLTDK
jgi:hypothetical protein